MTQSNDANKKGSRTSNGVKFEEALKKLEKIVEELESGKLSLDDSLKKYEEGMKLSCFCHKTLKEAQKKIQVLTKKGEGFKVKPFMEAEETEE